MWTTWTFQVGVKLINIKRFDSIKSFFSRECADQTPDRRSSRRRDNDYDPYPSSHYRQYARYSWL